MNDEPRFPKRRERITGWVYGTHEGGAEDERALYIAGKLVGVVTPMGWTVEHPMFAEPDNGPQRGLDGQRAMLKAIPKGFKYNRKHLKGLV